MSSGGLVRRTLSGGTEVLHFDRYAFLQQDGEGEWFWNDHFLFSVDAAASLAANRQAMWEETLRSLQNGAFGNPGELETLILYWSKLELLHYPGAKDTREQLERRRFHARIRRHFDGNRRVKNRQGVRPAGWQSCTQCAWRITAGTPMASNA